MEMQSSSQAVLSSQPSKIREAFLKVALLVIGTSVVLLPTEFLFRMFFGEQIVLFPRFHTEADYGKYKIRRLLPKRVFSHQSIDGRWEFRTNAQGFRNDRDFLLSRQPGTLRILAVGDSHTEGFEVSQEATYSVRLEKLLAESGKQAEVYNTGVSGFGTAEELVFLENSGLSYHPDIVVLGFFRNDFGDNLKSNLFRLKDGQLVDASHEHIPGVRILQLVDSVPGTSWLSQHSYAYSFVFNRLWDLSKSRLRQARSAAIGEQVTGMTIPSVYEQELTTMLLLRMNDDCQKANVRLFVLDIPWLNEGIPESSLGEKMRSLLEKSGVTIVSPLPPSSSTESLRQLHVPHGQRHLSAFGHQISADLLRLAILREGT